jgi:hypothetical protein
MPINIPNVFASIANATSIGNNIAFNLIEFNNSGTYTPPANLMAVEVFIGCGGSGGSSGSRTAAGTISRGGSPGYAGCCAWFYIDAGALTAPVSVVVGAGGAGGPSVTADNTNGTTSTAGGASLFWVIEGPIVPAVAVDGASTWNPLGADAVYAFQNQFWVNPAVYPYGWKQSGYRSISTGAVYTPAFIGNYGNAQESLGGGGTGGGVTTANVQYAGQVGGRMVYEWGTQITASPSGGNASSGNGHGEHGYNNFQLENAAGPLMKLTNSFGTLALGSGGGGGASRTSHKGGDSGNSGAHCAGGGGGGSSRNGHDSGKGSDGRDGFVKVLEILRV